MEIEALVIFAGKTLGSWVLGFRSQALGPSMMLNLGGGVKLSERLMNPMGAAGGKIQA